MRLVSPNGHGHSGRRLEKAVSDYHNVLARKEVIWSFRSRAPKNYLVWVEYSYGINPYDLAA